MLDDVVLDTDVLLHADNPASSRQDESVTLIYRLRHARTALCIDNEYKGDEASNRSAIVSEYLEHLPPGSLGFALFLELFKDDRVKAVSARVPKAANNAINQLIGDKTDRKFVKVAVNTAEHVLVSHDGGLQTPKAQIAAKVGVEILDAAEAAARL